MTEEKTYYVEKRRGKYFAMRVGEHGAIYVAKKFRTRGEADRYCNSRN